MNFKIIIILFCIISLIGCESEKFTAANGSIHEVSSLIGMNIFDIGYEYSEGSSETLIGTNNQRWVVYYEDINITFETKKSTNIVQKAKKGKNPKSSVWAD